MWGDLGLVKQRGGVEGRGGDDCFGLCSCPCHSISMITMFTSRVSDLVINPQTVSGAREPSAGVNIEY